MRAYWRIDTCVSAQLSWQVPTSFLQPASVGERGDATTVLPWRRCLSQWPSWRANNKYARLKQHSPREGYHKARILSLSR